CARWRWGAPFDYW
nr:immunoglobulin heavy chain junction region [Mus musculus]